MTNIAAKPLAVLQNDYIVQITGPAAIAARSLDITIHDVPAVSDRDIPSTPDQGSWSPIFVMGSIHFIDGWARNQEILAPWIFWNDANYDAAQWALHLQKSFLNVDGYTTTVRAFIESASEAKHIRPLSAKKLIGDQPRSEAVEGRRSLAGMVVTPQQLISYALDEDAEIWASPPKQIDAEVRVWMIDGKVAGASTYRVDGKQITDSRHPFVEAAQEAAQQLHLSWQPDRHYVVDLALHEGSWKLIEYNPIHTSGWYDVDPAKVIAAFMTAEASI